MSCQQSLTHSVRESSAVFETGRKVDVMLSGNENGRMTMTPVGPAKTLTQLVATEIKVEMARQDLRQSQLARKLGVTEQWLSVRLRGKQPIDLNDLARIAAGLNVSVYTLLPDPGTEINNATAGYQAAATWLTTGLSGRTDGTPKRRSRGPGLGRPKDLTRRPVMIPRPLPA